MSNNPLVGTWKLVRAGIRSSEDATEQDLYGADAVGYLIYGDDGYISGHVGNVSLPTSGFAAKVIKAIGVSGATYLSYCGTYKIEGSTVINSIIISSHPNYLQGERQHEFEVRGDRLTLVQQMKVNEQIQLIVRREWKKA